MLGKDGNPKVHL